MPTSRLIRVLVSLNVQFNRRPVTNSLFGTNCDAEEPAMKTADYSQSIDFGSAATYRIVVKGAFTGLTSAMNNLQRLFKCCEK